MTELEQTIEKTPVTTKNHGGRNLMLLGVVSILISLITSMVSLYVYHKSGDIYLDCSLPDADCPSARSDSEDNQRDNIYTFPDNGEITQEKLEEYLKELNANSEKLRKINMPFGGDALSDESLGI